MKNKYTYTILLIVFGIGLFSIFLRYIVHENNGKESFYELKERKGALGQSPEWTTTRTRAEKLVRAVRENPEDKKSALALAGLFIQEARVTGNYMYYDRAAMNQVNNVLAKDPEQFEALTIKALIYLSQHHFADGLAIATKAKEINPYNSFIYGILIDANVEMGNYKEAVEDAEKMISIRPVLRSYSRVSYLREIHGDYPGAIEAMKLAVDAGAPGEESTEWSRIQLAHLYENIGDTSNASFQYLTSLAERPQYPYAIAGLGHLAKNRKDFTLAIKYYEEADSLLIDNSFKEELIDIYLQTGQNEKANSLSKIVIDNLSTDATNASNNENIGHYADKELAYAFLKINKKDKALEHAIAEYNRRPGNIDANETVAWVYYNIGDIQKALPFIQEALKTNSKNPVLLCHAGLIYAKASDLQKAKMLLAEGLKNNPCIDGNLKSVATRQLEHINKQ